MSALVFAVSETFQRGRRADDVIGRELRVDRFGRLVAGVGSPRDPITTSGRIGVTVAVARPAVATHASPSSSEIAA